MIPLDKLILLDTNILIHLVRGNEIGKRIDSNYQLSARTQRPLLSIVTVGEVLAIAYRRGWGDAKIERMKELMRELVIVDISHLSLVEKYAEFDSYSKANGLNIGQNDLWIAATAAVTSAHLLTTDRDFDGLHPTLIQRDYFNPGAP